jgi:predicted RecA/RadA family phage recombinase
LDKAMKNYIQRGEVLDFTIPAATTVTSGELVEVGAMAGVAVTGGDAGDVIAVQLEGVFRLPKVTGAINVGAKVYSNGEGSVTTDSDDGETEPTAYVFVGYAFETVASNAANVAVKLAK